MHKKRITIIKIVVSSVISDFTKSTHITDMKTYDKQFLQKNLKFISLNIEKNAKLLVLKLQKFVSFIYVKKKKDLRYVSYRICWV